MVACANSVVGGVIVNVGGEVGVAKGVDVVCRGEEGKGAEYNVKVWCVEEVSIGGQRGEDMSDDVEKWRGGFEEHGMEAGPQEHAMA